MYRMIPDMSQWFGFGNSVSRLTGMKLLLLAIMGAFAADTRLRLVPRLSEDNPPSLAWHSLPVMAVSVLLVFGGVSFSTGWLY